jgi:hypothetical protein
MLRQFTFVAPILRSMQEEHSYLQELNPALAAAGTAHLTA